MRAFLLAGFVLVAMACFVIEPPVIYPKDLQLLTGSKWKGFLTYRDYSSEKQITIDADVSITPGPDSLTWYFHNQYPKEPHANSTDTVIISRDGQMIGKEKVVSRHLQKDTINIVTQKDVMDDGVRKTFRYTYRISPSFFVIRKEESKEGGGFFQRNIYTYSR